METIHILVITDRPNDVESLRSLLSAKVGASVRYHVEEEGDWTEAIKSLIRNTYDVYLVEQGMNHYAGSGSDLIKKANAGGCRSATILMTLLSDEDVEWIVSECGATDHIHKTFDFEERTIRNSIRQAMRYNEDVQDIREQLRTIQQQISEMIRVFEKRG